MVYTLNKFMEFSLKSKNKENSYRKKNKEIKNYIKPPHSSVYAAK